MTDKEKDTKPIPRSIRPNVKGFRMLGLKILTMEFDPALNLFKHSERSGLIRQAVTLELYRDYEEYFYKTYQNE